MINITGVDFFHYDLLDMIVLRCLLSLNIFQFILMGINNNMFNCDDSHNSVQIRWTILIGYKGEEDKQLSIFMLLVSLNFEMVFCSIRSIFILGSHVNCEITFFFVWIVVTMRARGLGSFRKLWKKYVQMLIALVLYTNYTHLSFAVQWFLVQEILCGGRSSTSLLTSFQ